MPSMNSQPNRLDLRVVKIGHEWLQELLERLVLGWWQDVLDLRANELVLGQPEVERADLVAIADDATLADREQRLGHAIENSFQWSGIGERLRDRRFHLVVMLVDQLQQLEKVRFLNSRRLCCLLDLVADVLMHRPASSIH